MTTSQIRNAFLEYYRQKGHNIITPSSIIPENDPTTLFTSSGMQPLVPYLLGEKHPQGKRLVNSQRSFRSQDIDEVGDSRHTTFFEMLGNWSLGDYFKKEQLNWFFDFLVKSLFLDPTKLYVTVFKGDKFIPKDSESEFIWKEIFLQETQNFHNIGINEITVNNMPELGIKNSDRIFYYGVENNWWSRSGPPGMMPVGEPGGPDSEVFYDFGVPHNDKFGKFCHPNCSCGRFLEIGNSVFMQYQKVKDGFKDLPNKNVDFGGGLERLTAAVSDHIDVFQIDIFKPLIAVLEKESDKNYREYNNKKAMQIIADHIRASVFMIADGVLPSNKYQGYMLRRLIRRSLVYGRELGITPNQGLFRNLVDPLIEGYEGFYTFLRAKKDEIIAILTDESEKFGKTLDKGIKELEKIKTIDGKSAFWIYETYGFPWELTVEQASKKGQTIEKSDFEKEFKKHQELSRKTSQGIFKGGLADSSEKTKKLHTATHLLNAALIKILGNHVIQKGSHITAERLRFDFTNNSPLTDEVLKKIENLVNEQIKKNLKVIMKVEPLEKAVKEGAIANFINRYDKEVKVYTIGNDKEWFSKEVCGGPHVDFTSKLGLFRIKKEEGVASGIRRIYAEVI